MRKDKTLKKTLIVFYVLVLVCVAQLSWWALLLMRSYDRIDADQTKITALEEEKILREVFDAIMKNRFDSANGTTVLLEGRNFVVDADAVFEFYKGRYPGYRVRVSAEWDPAVRISPIEESVTASDDFLTTKLTMVFSEGAFFVLLLILGVLAMYRALKTEFSLNRSFENFLLGITHELKSPLSAIKLNLQTLMIRDLKKEDKVRFLENSVEEVERLNDLVENVLIAARIEKKGYQYDKEPLELSQLIEENVTRFLKVSKKKPQFKLDMEPVTFKGDRLTLGSVFHNLIENSVKYSGDQPEVFVRLRREGNRVVIEFADNGSGIPDEEKLRVFNKFYRIGSENTRQSKGTGLGLYIVHEVVEKHSGIIKALDNNPNGTVMRIELSD